MPVFVFPEGHFNINDIVGRGQEPHYIPLSLINTNDIVPNNMHCPVLQSCFTWKIWKFQKGKKFIQFICILPY